MAHECPDCGLYCHCNGDIDDMLFDDMGIYCTHCDRNAHEDEEWEFDDDFNIIEQKSERRI